jgi:hypothetical protein
MGVKTISLPRKEQAVLFNKGYSLICIAANQVSIAVTIVNLGDVWEELRGLDPLQWEGCLLA